MLNQSYSVVLPAAGLGTRMRAELPKVLLPLFPDAVGGESILARTVARFAEDTRCRAIVVCVNPDLQAEFRRVLEAFPNILIVNGGATRQESVRCGLNALASHGLHEDDIVLIHDAARCLVSKAVVHRVVDEVETSGAATAAVPVVDSMVRGTEQGIDTYVDRAGLWSIQTPQGFKFGEIVAAHEAASREGIEALDDASLALRTRTVKLVLGDRLNIKLTTPEDLDLARKLVAQGVMG